LENENRYELRQFLRLLNNVLNRDPVEMEAKGGGKYDLVKLGESAQLMGEILGKTLPKEAIQ
jgi:hypothetical protein